MRDVGEEWSFLWTPDKLRTFKGFEHYSDEQAINAIKSIDKLAHILLSFMKENTTSHEQPESIQKFRKRHGKTAS